MAALNTLGILHFWCIEVALLTHEDVALEILRMKGRVAESIIRRDSSMRSPALLDAILRCARRSFFNGVGKVCLKEFMEEYKTSIDEIRSVLVESGIKHRFWPPTEKPSILLVYF